MDNFTDKSANKIWRESGSSLCFKDWLEREKKKEVFIPNKILDEFNNASGTITTPQAQIQQNLKDASAKMNQSSSSTKFNYFGLNKTVLAMSLGLIVLGISYSLYTKYKK